MEHTHFLDGFGGGAVIKEVFRSRMVWNQLCVGSCAEHANLTPRERQNRPLTCIDVVFILFPLPA